jgi:hypothetical protein
VINRRLQRLQKYKDDPPCPIHLFGSLWLLIWWLGDQQEAAAPAGQQASQVLTERKGDSRNKNPGREVLQNCLCTGLPEAHIMVLTIVS